MLHTCIVHTKRHFSRGVGGRLARSNRRRCEWAGGWPTDAAADVGGDGEGHTDLLQSCPPVLLRLHGPCPFIALLHLLLFSSSYVLS